MSIRMEMLTNNASSPDPLHQEVVYKRPLSYSKMESLIKEMQDPEHGVPVRSQKLFLSSVPAAFAGYDIIEWLMERMSIEDSVEAIHLANLLCQHGYFFPVGDNRAFSVKDDSSLYRFQTPYYWPSQLPSMDTVDYAIYLAKRTLRNKQKHGLDDYEVEAFNDLRKNLNQKWDFISMQADEQVRISKDRKKPDKVVIDSQERAFWRVLRPPPGVSCCVETPPMYKADFHAHEGTKQIRRTNILEDLRAEVDLLRTSCIRTRIKVSHALESLATHCESYHEHDPLLVARQPSNPWHSDDPTYWIINAPLVEIPTERRVKKWGISMEDLVFDPTGLREFTAYLKKEYCHENIRFWLAVRDLRFGPICQLRGKAQQIYNEFLSPGAPCEINIDMRTMELVQKELNYLTPSRFTFDPAADHVYAMLLKKDCYPRFIRSEHYKSLVANALQPNQKKRLDKFFSFVAPGKKKSSTTTPPNFQMGVGMSLQGGYGMGGDDILLFSSGNKSDLLSASSQETDKLSVMADCPYRGDLIPDGKKDNESVKNTLSQASMDDVCPWESMERLPSASEKSASTSVPVPIPIPKPSTSAAAAAAYIRSSCSPKQHQLAKKKSEDHSEKTGHRSGPPSKQSSILSKQGSTASQRHDDFPEPPIIQAVYPNTASEKTPLALIQRQESTASTKSMKSQNEKENVPPPPPASTSTPSISTAVSFISSNPALTSASLISLVEDTTTKTPQTVTVTTPSSSASITSSTSTLVPSTSGDKSETSTLKEVSMRTDEQTREVSSAIKTTSSSLLTKGRISRVGSKDHPEEKGIGDEKKKEVDKNDEDPKEYKVLRKMSSVDSVGSGSSKPLLAKTESSEGNTKEDKNDDGPGTANVSGVPEEGPPIINPHHVNRKMSREEDVCPWDHENGTRPETETFVKTYSTLGYL